MRSTDWSQWHDGYASTGLAERLTAVRVQIDRYLDANDSRPVRVVSACAGDGRDLLGVLARRLDADRVTAMLVEYDVGLAARAREAAAALPARVEVRQADAAQSDVYIDSVPADLILLCGIFGNVTNADVQTMIKAIPQLCAPGAEVVWTRHRHAPDLTPAIRRWFSEAGFSELAFVAPDHDFWSVGAYRLTGEPRPLEPGRHWFTFIR